MEETIIKSILSVKNLKKTFKNITAVNDISFSLEKGDIFAFLGPNGAGKTTTLRILLDIIKGDSGQIVWNLEGNSGTTPMANQIGYLPEERGLYTDLPVIRSLVYLATIRGMEPSIAKISAMEWLEKLELADRAKEKLQTLSKGNQQKIQFVASILHKPACAILDEPFSGLDPLNQEKFIGFIKELNNEGTTILLSSHQMLLVEKIARKVFFINRGEKVFSGSLSDIYAHFGKQQFLELTFQNEIPRQKLLMISSVDEINCEDGQRARVFFKSATNFNHILTEIAAIEGVTHISSGNLNLHEIFLQLVKNH